MKKIASLLLLMVLGLTGCARHYVITLNTGAQISTRSKPKLQNGVYVFKDGAGNPASLPQGRVTEISPASIAAEDKRNFAPSSK